MFFYSSSTFYSHNYLKITIINNYTISKVLTLITVLLDEYILHTCTLGSLIPTFLKSFQDFQFINLTTFIKTNKQQQQQNVKTFSHLKSVKYTSYK